MWQLESQMSAYEKVRAHSLVNASKYHQCKMQYIARNVAKHYRRSQLKSKVLFLTITGYPETRSLFITMIWILKLCFITAVLVNRPSATYQDHSSKRDTPLNCKAWLLTQLIAHTGLQISAQFYVADCHGF